MTYFGTDGIRRSADFFDETFLTAFAWGVASLPACRVVALGRDTRESGQRISSVLENALLSFGVRVVDAGVLPSPALAFCTRRFRCDYGVMITASHNPASYNGLKLFTSLGEKADGVTERRVEEAMRTPARPSGTRGALHAPDARSAYLTYAKDAFPAIGNKRVLVDCANGAAAEFAGPLFRALGASPVVLGTTGRINDGCGATHPSYLLSRYAGEDVGFALDGDGDRVIAVRDGMLYDGDRIVYACVLDSLARGKRVGGVCGTVLTNSAYQNAYSRLGVPFYRAEVGDRNVYEKMLKTGCSVGGETSGHVLFPAIGRTGDGLLTAAIFASACDEAAKKARALSVLPVSSSDLPLDEERAAFCREKSAGSVSFYEDGVRCVVRVSGTENVLRVTCEGDGAEKVLSQLERGAWEVICSSIS